MQALNNISLESNKSKVFLYYTALSAQLQCLATHSLLRILKVTWLESRRNSLARLSPPDAEAWSSFFTGLPFSALGTEPLALALPGIKSSTIHYQIFEFLSQTQIFSSLYFCNLMV